MRDTLTRFFASGFASGRGPLAYLLHLRRPLAVVIATSRGFAVGMMPDMRHLMGEG